MAYDKVVDSAVLDGYFDDIADAIRAKTGDSATMTPADMPGEIASIQSGMDPNFEALISGTASGEIDIRLPEYAYALGIEFGGNNPSYHMANYNVTKLTVRGVKIWGNGDVYPPNGGMRFSGEAMNLSYIELTDCEQIVMQKSSSGTNAFRNLEDFIAPKLTKISNGNGATFGGSNASKLKQFVCPNYTYALEGSMFSECTAMTLADVKTTNLNSSVFYDCSALVAVVLRNSTPAVLSYVSAFTGTPIASGTGYIYVPRDLISTYEAATNWSTYAGQFRAIEDYTADGTLDGDFVMPTA